MQKKKSPARQGGVRRMLLIGLVMLAAGLAWQKLPRQEVQPPPVSTPAPAGEDKRTAREKAYEQDAETLRMLMNDKEGTAREQASLRLAQLVEEHQTELGIEEALRAAGYSSAFVLMQNGALTVLLDPENLTEEVSAAVLALCTAHSDVEAENIRIMPGAA